jgi:hypothetical protein
LDIEKIKAAIDSVWGDYDVIGLRLQSGAESKRTRVGDTLRPSNHWIDCIKTRRKMTGTAAFVVPGWFAVDVARLARVLDSMARNGYQVNSVYDRLVIVGSNHTGMDGEQMPEAYSNVLVDAKLLAVIE